MAPVVHVVGMFMLMGAMQERVEAECWEKKVEVAVQLL